jgi:hypothetical protein
MSEFQAQQIIDQNSHGFEEDEFEEKEEQNFNTVIMRAGDDYKNQEYSYTPIKASINLNLEEVKEERDRRGREERSKLREK